MLLLWIQAGGLEDATKGCLKETCNRWMNNTNSWSEWLAWLDMIRYLRLRGCVYAFVQVNKELGIVQWTLHLIEAYSWFSIFLSFFLFSSDLVSRVVLFWPWYKNRLGRRLGCCEMRLCSRKLSPFVIRLFLNPPPCPGSSIRGISRTVSWLLKLTRPSVQLESRVSSEVSLVNKLLD